MPWLAQSSLFTLITQLHAVNARWKRVSQRSYKVKWVGWDWHLGVYPMKQKTSTRNTKKLSHFCHTRAYNKYKDIKWSKTPAWNWRQIFTFWDKFCSIWLHVLFYCCRFIFVFRAIKMGQSGAEMLLVVVFTNSLGRNLALKKTIFCDIPKRILIYFLDLFNNGYSCVHTYIVIFFDFMQ